LYVYATYLLMKKNRIYYHKHDVNNFPLNLITTRMPFFDFKTMLEHELCLSLLYCIDLKETLYTELQNMFTSRQSKVIERESIFC